MPPKGWIIPKNSNSLNQFNKTITYTPLFRPIMWVILGFKIANIDLYIVLLKSLDQIYST